LRYEPDRGYRNVDIKQMMGARIKEIKTKKGITQEQLPEMMEINPKYLSSIERGKENPTLSTLIRLSESLEVDLGEVFSFVDPEDRNRLKSQIISLLDEADSERLKMIFKVLSVIVH
jgi:transcriptional regulator with XRE-family HTH domain